MIESTIGSRWFRRYPVSQGPATRRLVCLPHAGGAAGTFHGWAEHLGAGVELLAARYPGRQERIAEECLTSMEDLADAVTAALLPLLDLPLHLFGHSMGATLGYEVALRLEREHGVSPAGLYVSSRKAPHRVTPNPAHLGGDREVLDELRSLGGTEMRVLDDPDLFELLMPAIRADFRIVGTYPARPVRRLGCPVSGYVGDRDTGITPADMAAWADAAPGPFDLRVFPGGHFYLTEHREALVRDLAARIA
ncbi:thioesterase [Kitasatospora sp. NA04385]|uniref:thioesterase II family protein n=1 Tax=Kitasatospora sp. NA04385 TaxID=2742135 RepID=UPI001164C43A|nr:alpha/beta fold hydrolase [Kitasatospora sp. NA04385]QDJ74283.1 thioesterase TEII family [Kitasatospora sp.]QKW22415.1 thioesterase [Kitasatospora sp. NA04385]